jgi:hypothetical protein|nr:MAG TPA: hypothetical protein [Caudoviricetes sp.]
METAILTVTTVVFAFLTLKWKIATLILSTWLKQNQYKEPTKEDLKDCAGFVAENLRKRPTDLFKH